MHKPIRFPQGDVGIAPYIFEKVPLARSIYKV